MTDWKQKLAARMAGPSDDKADESPAAAPARPAWARVATDRAAGREPSQEDVDEARARGRQPRAEWQQRLLERMGYGDEPPAA